MAPTLDAIERTRLYLLESCLPEDTKDNLQNLLDAALKADRSRDIDGMGRALAQAVAALAIHEVRQAVRAPDAVQTAIDTHIATLHNGQSSSLPSTRIEVIVYLLAKPWPWVALTVGVFSPHLPRIIEAVKTLWR